jgi:hypothetical protein
VEVFGGDVEASGADGEVFEADAEVDVAVVVVFEADVEVDAEVVVFGGFLKKKMSEGEWLAVGSGGCGGEVPPWR